MGYHSDVCLCLSKNGWDSFAEKFNSSDRAIAETVNDLISNPTKHHSDRNSAAQLWFWEDIKWYPDYADISFMESLMSDLNGDDYLYIRIGEDSDDNEVSGSFWDNPFGLYLSRQICFERPENGNI